MNRILIRLPFWLIVVCLSPTVACSQVEFVERMNKGFLSDKPQLGEQVNNVKLYDEYGNDFQLNETRGKHTVLIFGCLT